MTEAGEYRGIDPDGVLETEADHFMKCPGCGQWFGMRARPGAGERSRRRD